MAHMAARLAVNLMVRQSGADRQSWLHPHLIRANRRFASKASSANVSVCIVGSGPAGFYTAQGLLRRARQSNPPIGLTIDMLEKLPVPFGLVRYGVAPDHPEVKNVEKTFAKVAQDINFVGNLNVGGDVKVSELRQLYDVVVLAYGAANDRKLNIPGEEDTSGVLSARSFVGFYNGLPADANLDIDLSKHKRVAIVGVGNVALDVARVLMTPIDVLAKTDMTAKSLEMLAASTVEDITIVGRRGPIDVAFTIKEMREMIKLTSARHQSRSPIDAADFAGITPAFIDNLDRRKRRLIQLMYDTSHASPATFNGSGRCEWRLRLFSVPCEIVADDGGNVSSLAISLNRYEYDDRSNAFVVTPTSDVDSIQCSLLLRSIGYRSVKVEEGIPFDEKRGVVLNEGGRVVGEAGLYCAGWLATGPRGVIVDTMTEAHGVAARIWDDVIDADAMCARDVKSRPGHPGLVEMIRQRSLPTVEYVDWQRIDAIEQAAGAERGKPREKLTNFAPFLSGDLDGDKP